MLIAVLSQHQAKKHTPTDVSFPAGPASHPWRSKEATANGIAQHQCGTSDHPGSTRLSQHAWPWHNCTCSFRPFWQRQLGRLDLHVLKASTAPPWTKKQPNHLKSTRCDSLYFMHTAGTSGMRHCAHAAGHDCTALQDCLTSHPEQA